MARQSAFLDEKADPAAPGGKRRFVVNALPLTADQDGRHD